uniref:Uncharacterized protein n=1 Tax=Saccharomyces cerevisiae TaxID=4932 RepID=E9PAE1_YEASX|nr:putative protein [Saccharomyces cerevisiae]
MMIQMIYQIVQSNTLNCRKTLCWIVPSTNLEIIWKSCPKLSLKILNHTNKNLPLMIMKLAAWTIQKYLNYFNQPPQRHHLWYLYPHPQQRHRLQGLTIAKLLIKPKTPL